MAIRIIENGSGEAVVSGAVSIAEALNDLADRIGGVGHFRSTAGVDRSVTFYDVWDDDYEADVVERYEWVPGEVAWAVGDVNGERLRVPGDKDVAHVVVADSMFDAVEKVFGHRDFGYFPFRTFGQPSIGAWRVVALPQDEYGPTAYDLQRRNGPCHTLAPVKLNYSKKARRG